MAAEAESSRIRFAVDEAEVAPSRQASALIVHRLFEQLGLGSLLEELGLDKEHGVAAEEAEELYCLRAQRRLTSPPSTTPSS